MTKRAKTEPVVVGDFVEVIKNTRSINNERNAGRVANIAEGSFGYVSDEFTREGKPMVRLLIRGWGTSTYAVPRDRCRKRTVSTEST